MERKAKPVWQKINREEFLLRCQTALETAGQQRLQLDIVVNTIANLAKKANMFESHPDFRVEYLSNSVTNEVTLRIFPKKVGFDLDERKRAEG